MPIRSVSWPTVLVGALLVVGLGILGQAPMRAESPAPAKTNPASDRAQSTKAAKPAQKEGKSKMAKATFGGGCFWCTEAVFQSLKGVESVLSGYSGGTVPNPTYEQICQKNTGHAEVIQITYDPAQVSYEQLLEVFWMTHDPTTPNQQGHDKGPQYRSVVFYHDDQQKTLADQYKVRLDKSGAFAQPIVTEISPAKEFYPAEDYHQGFFKRNPSQPYCQAVIRPKMDKFKKAFADKLKSDQPAAK